MAVFPSLVPSTRTFSPGEYPHSRHEVISGRSVRVLHSDAFLSSRLRLSFIGCSTADLLSIRDHYFGQFGRRLAFELSASVLNGLDVPADFSLTGYRWLYVRSPQVVDVPIVAAVPTVVHDVTVELEAIPGEAVMAPGARLRAQAVFLGGSAERGVVLTAFATLTPGVASGG